MHLMMYICFLNPLIFRYMRNFFIALTMLLTIAATAQTNVFDMVYLDTVEISGGTSGLRLRATTDGQYAWAGAFHGDDPLVVKTDTLGFPLWSKTTDGSEPFRALLPAPDSGLIAAGENIIAKFNANGETIWSYQLSSTTLHIRSVECCTNGDLLLSGNSSTPAIFASEGFLMRMSQAGVLVFARIYTLVPNLFTSFVKALEHPDGGYLVYGATSTTPNGTPMGIALCRLDEEGNGQWVRIFSYGAGSYQPEYALDMVTTPTGIAMLAASWGGNTVLVKTDYSGNLSWAKSYNTYFDPLYYFDISSTLNQLPDGGFAFSVASVWALDSPLIITDSLGEVTKAYEAFMDMTDAIVTNELNYLALGLGPVMAYKDNAYGLHVGFYKVDTLGVFPDCSDPSWNLYEATPVQLQSDTLELLSEQIPITLEPGPQFTDAVFKIRGGCVDIEGSVADVPVPAFTLTPNPANEQVQLATNGLDPGNHWQAEVFDATGNRLLEIADFDTQNQKIETRHLPSGLYMVVLTHPHQRLTMKLMVQH